MKVLQDEIKKEKDARSAAQDALKRAGMVYGARVSRENEKPSKFVDFGEGF